MFRICLLAALLSAPGFLHAQIKLRNKKELSEISYTMNHMLHEWTGISRDVTCIMETNDRGEVQKVAALAKVASFDSKNSNRDSHMLEVVQALTYPNIAFESTTIQAQAAGKYQVKGKMTFHGVTRPVEFTVSEEKTGNLRQFSGNFTLLLEDFKIERPSFMMVKTDNEMKVSLKMVF